MAPVLFVPVLALLVSLLACGDDAPPGPMEDAAMPDGETSMVTPPEIPWVASGVPPIALTPCPDGWRETGDGIAECDPYPADGPESCASGEAHFPGEAGCRPIGDPCPATGFAPALPTEGVIYVDVAAAPGGDGTLAAPFTSLTDVSWSSLTAGTTVALAAGSYDGVASLKAGVSLVGACVAETVLTGVDAPVAAVVLVTSAGDAASLSNVTIRDASQLGVLVGDGRALDIDGVRIEGAEDRGISVEGAGSRVVASDIVIEDTRGVARLENGGVAVNDGATLEMRRFILSDNDEAGALAANPGSTLTLEHGAIRRTRFRPSDRMAGFGVTIFSDAEATLASLLIEECRTAGLSLTTGSVSVTDLVVRQTRTRASDGTGGIGVFLEEGAALNGRRIVIAENAETALLVRDRESTVTLEDVVARGLPDESAADGRGMSVEGGASLSATRMALTDNAGSGLVTDQPETGVQLTDVVVATSVRGVSVETGSAMVGTRLLITDNEEAGLIIARNAMTTLTDSVVRRTVASSFDGDFGRGVSLQEEARIEATRVEISENQEIGFFAALASTATLDDVSVRDTLPDPDGTAGHGLVAQQASRVTGQRVAIDGAHGIGLLALFDAVADLRAVVIERVEEQTCTSCAGTTYGHATAALSSDITLSDFTIRDAATCGVLLDLFEGGRAPSVDLVDGTIERTAIGACVQVEGYDLDRLTSGVRYQDNGTNLDSVRLPSPELAGVVE